LFNTTIVYLHCLVQYHHCVFPLPCSISTTLCVFPQPCSIPLLCVSTALFNTTLVCLHCTTVVCFTCLVQYPPLCVLLIPPLCLSIALFNTSVVALRSVRNTCKHSSKDVWDGLTKHTYNFAESFICLYAIVVTNAVSCVLQLLTYPSQWWSFARGVNLELSWKAWCSLSPSVFILGGWSLIVRRIVNTECIVTHVLIRLCPQ